MVRMRIHILDLPFDILAVLFTQLDAKDFVSFCCTCSELYEHSSDLDFWRSVTQSTFRLPNRPSAQYDGKRWKSLYRRLRHETQIYLWGQQSRTRNLLTGETDRVHLNIFKYPLSEHPLKGVIVDMQIGGWSTTVLDTTGMLYTSGPLYSERGSSEVGSDSFVPLKFRPQGSNDLPDTASGGGESNATNLSSIPASSFHNPGLIAGGAATPEGPHVTRINPFPPRELDKSSTKIQKFSAGRGHVIALADDGTAWFWYRVSRPAVKLEFPDIGNAHVEWVCGGFNHSSAYIRNWGIVVWDYVLKYPDLVSNPRPWNISTSGDSSMLVQRSAGDDPEVGKVIKHILLEKFVIFITDRGKLFCSSIFNPPTFEIPEFGNVIDIQGSFRSFGIFKKDGSIIIGHQDLLRLCERRATEPHFEEDINLPDSIPALQNSGVVQLAFGDYHFHALHSDGRITSYGKEPRSSGALGLSGIKSQTATRVRGVRMGIADLVLLPHGYFTGRSVWFSEAKHKWLSAITAEFTSHPIQDEGKLGEFSEWIEQRGSNWDEIPEVANLNHDGLGSHFALSVAAGGWSSGALLLVNEEMDKEIDRLCPPPRLENLPNIEFSDGSYSSPGTQHYGWKKNPPVFNIAPGDGDLWGVSGWILTNENAQVERNET